MWIELDYTPDLDSEDVHAFVLDSDPSNTLFKSPLLTESGMIAVASRPIEEAPLPGPLYAFIKETYAIERNRQGVGRQEIVVPVMQAMRLLIVNTLFVRNDVQGTPFEAKLKEVFSAYVFEPSGPPPHDYARRELPPEITDDMFLVRPSFELLKDGDRIERTEQRDAMIALYAGQASGDFHLPIGSGDGIGDYFGRGDYRMILISRDPCRVGQPVQDPNVYETSDVDDDPGAVIDELVGVEANELDCNHIEVIQERVVTLLQWPEFKIEWEPKRVKIGCVRITVRLPVLSIRITKLALYYFYGKIKNLGRLIESIIEACALKSVVAGAIIGIALSNIQAAIVAFRTVFVECVKSQAGQAISCLIPGLLILKEKGNWGRA
jgi:hypothetical protein